jgi:hypothetical protein
MVDQASSLLAEMTAERTSHQNIADHGPVQRQSSGELRARTMPGALWSVKNSLAGAPLAPP